MPGFLRFPEAKSGKSGVKSETGERESNKTQRDLIFSATQERRKKTTKPKLLTVSTTKIADGFGKDFLKHIWMVGSQCQGVTALRTQTGRCLLQMALNM